jgi:peptidoglycan/xylan/chitin deacetylase (PgdA/CDA1 family)
MSASKNTVIRFGLEGVWLTGAHRLAGPFLGGLGVILTLHCVRPDEARPFAPNGILKITPAFLDAVLARVRAQGFDIVDLDEALRRLSGEGEPRRFVVVTLDDGYRDNLQHAWPIFRRHQAPFTIYVPTDYPAGQGELWWLAVEEILAAESLVSFPIDGVERPFDTADLQGKSDAWAVIYEQLRRMDEDAQRAAIRALADRHGFDLAAQCRREIMTWEEVADIAADPLCTIGAHTLTHRALAKLDEARARDEMARSADILAGRLGVRPRHVSYPYGSPDAAGEREFRLAAELGFASGVTTRPGVLYAEHASHRTALPRISLNGAFQSLRYVDVLLSGLPTYLWNRCERLSVA